MNNQKTNSYSELFIDESQTIPKTYDEISRTDTWKNMPSEERLEFIHNYINPEYLHQGEKSFFGSILGYKPSVKEKQSVKYKTPVEEKPSDEYKPDIRFKIATDRPTTDQLNWSFTYEGLIREKIFWKLKYELQRQGGSRRKIKLLEEMLHNINILQSSDQESLILIEIIKGEIDFWRKTEDEEEEQTTRKIDKIKWKASPSIFGFLMNELVKHGYIEPPLRGGEYNFTGLAKLCYNYFEINSPPENVIKELNPNKNALSEIKRAKFTIPEISDLK